MWIKLLYNQDRNSPLRRVRLCPHLFVLWSFSMNVQVHFLFMYQWRKVQGLGHNIIQNCILETFKNRIDILMSDRNCLYTKYLLKKGFQRCGNNVAFVFIMHRSNSCTTTCGGKKNKKIMTFYKEVNCNNLLGWKSYWKFFNFSKQGHDIFYFYFEDYIFVGWNLLRRTRLYHPVIQYWLKILSLN